jgi:hypothetical protein
VNHEHRYARQDGIVNDDGIGAPDWLKSEPFNRKHLGRACHLSQCRSFAELISAARCPEAEHCSDGGCAGYCTGPPDVGDANRLEQHPHRGSETVRQTGGDTAHGVSGSFIILPTVQPMPVGELLSFSAENTTDAMRSRNRKQ